VSPTLKKLFWEFNNFLFFLISQKLNFEKSKKLYKIVLIF
jgi:hypothetical protein